MTRIIFAFLFLIAAAAIFWQWTLPAYEQIKILEEEKAVVEEALANSRQLQKLRDEILSQYNIVSQDELNRLNKLLPSQLDTDSLITMLESRAQAHGLLLKKIDTVSSARQAQTSQGQLGQEGALIAAPPLYETAPLIFPISGPYNSVISFLKDLEKNIRLIDVGSLSFSSAAADIYEFNVSAKLYFAAPQSSVLAESQGGGRNILFLLKKLEKIKIDLDFFGSDVFKSLVDFSLPLEIPKDYGRENPFAPLEGEATSKK
jgi:Tfp pilus assembly protein PilO